MTNDNRKNGFRKYGPVLSLCLREVIQLVRPLKDISMLDFHLITSLVFKYFYALCITFMKGPISKILTCELLIHQQPRFATQGIQGES